MVSVCISLSTVDSKLYFMLSFPSDTLTFLSWIEIKFGTEKKRLFREITVTGTG